MIHKVSVTLQLTDEQFRNLENLSQMLGKSKDQLATEGFVEYHSTLYDNPERLAQMIVDVGKTRKS